MSKQVALALKRPIERLAYRRDEAAAALGVSVSTFDDWVVDGLVPKPLKIGGVRLWDKKALETAWDKIAGRVDAGSGWQARSGL